MKIYCFIFFILIINQAIGQPGFSNTYEMDAPGAGFHSPIWDGEHIVVAGTASVDSLDQWGLLFAKFDTLGNLIDHKIHTDPDGSDYLFSRTSKMIQTSDGGYIILGSFKNPKKGFMAKLNMEGELEFLQDYLDPDAQSYQFNIVLELEDGYMIGGLKSIANLTKKAFVMKTDLVGNQIWEKKYGEADNSNGFGDLKYIDDNTFLVSASISKFPFSIVFLDHWTKSWIFAIDSIGNIKWEWTSEENEEVLPTDIYQTDDGGYIYNTGEFVMLNPWTWGTAVKAVKRDSNFNLVWIRNLSPFVTNESRPLDMVATPDGNWVALGVYVSSDSDTLTSNDWVGNCLYKFSSEGDSIWSRCDSISTDSFFHLGELFGITTLSSGSIIGAGLTERHGGGIPSRNSGWLLKVSKNGCVDTLCDISTTLFPPKPILEKINLFPNPTSDKITLDFSSNQKGKHWISVFNLSGEEILSRSIMERQEEIDLSHFAAGVYFYRIMNNQNEIIKSGKIIKQ